MRHSQTSHMSFSNLQIYSSSALKAHSSRIAHTPHEHVLNTPRTLCAFVKTESFAEMCFSCHAMPNTGCTLTPTPASHK